MVNPQDIKSKIKELQRIYKEGPIYFINKYIRVKDVGDDSIPLRLYPIQIELVRTIMEKHHVIILGSRQTGKTTILNAIIAYLMRMYPNYWVLHVSRNNDQAAEDLAEIKFMLEHLPKWMKPKFLPPDNLKRKKIDNGSMIVSQPTATEKSSSSKGRGLRAPFLWIDEAAFVNLKLLRTSVFPVTARAMLNAKKKGIPYALVLSSTPNGTSGIGKEFYDMWRHALRANNIYDEILDNPMDFAQQSVSAFYPFKIHWRQIPVYDEAWYEERKQENGYYESAERRQEFKQEFELVFLGTKDSLFPSDLISELQMSPPILTTKVFRTDDGEYNTNNQGQYLGEINWFSEIQPDKLYLIGVDVSTYLGGNDYTAIEIVQYDTLEQIGEFHAKCRVEYTNYIIDYLIKNVIPYSIVIPESNGLGNQVIEFMTSNDYRLLHLFTYEKETNDGKQKQYYGLVNTNGRKTKVRSLILDSIFLALTDNPKRIHSHVLITEIPGIRQVKPGRYEGDHDDTVFAYGFTTYVAYNHKQDILSNMSYLPKNNIKYNKYIEDVTYNMKEIISLNTDISNKSQLVGLDKIREIYPEVYREFIRNSSILKQWRS